MKMSDLFEYNMGIQGKDANSKSKVDEPEIDVPGEEIDDPKASADKNDDAEKTLAQGSRKVGAMSGKKVQGQLFAKGAGKVATGKMPNKTELKQLAPILGDVTNAMSNPKFANRLGALLKQAGKEGVDESTLAKKILKKLTSKKPGKSIRKKSRLLQEADPKLFEINFNKKEIAREGLDAPVKCGFEAETFFYSVEDSRASDDVDNMSVSDVEYEYGDLPDSAYSDYNDWIMEKAMDEYLPDYIDRWIDDNRDEDEFIQDFMNSGNGPTQDAVEEYKDNFKDDDPNEYENREEDGWDDDNWARDLINEEYEDDYEDFLREIANDDDQLRDDAVNECEGDYDMDGWINDQWYSMSAFLDDYGYEYSSESGSVEGVASELYRGWIEKNSKFDEYPEYGEYGETGVTDRWAVETDSSIDPDEGAGAELISPVFSSTREMLKEMKSLFEWSKGEFGTNSTTGLHITMSWQGKGTEPNKLKMAMLIGDEYLLDLFGRLRNSYTRSQYRNVLKYAEEIDAGKLGNFEKLEAVLQKGISRDKFSSINFKGQKDSSSGNELIEFRIAGGRDYNEMYKEVVQACVRYGTIMKAGYEPDAFRQDYIKAVSRLLRKSKEVDPKTAKEFDEINAPIIDSAKELVSKKEYFDVLKSLEISLRKFQQYEDAIDPEADKKWKQSVKDFEKGTGRKVGANLKEEEITGYIEPSAIPPSQYAPAYLKKAQESFIKAVAILAKDISNGTNRSNPNAKSIRVFRDYANQLKLDDNNLQDLLVQQIDDIRPEYNDKENIALLDKGVKALFKKDLIKTPEFLSPQNVDHILKQVWQFAMSDDVNDNTKLNKLVKLLQKVSPHLEDDEIAQSLETSLKSRQENDFVRKMKNGGYSEKGLLKIGKITTPGSAEELLKFLQPYSGYKHPTSQTHHVNIKSDDRYSQVFQMRLMQRLRDRLEHLKALEIDDPEKANKLKEQLCDIGIELLEGLKPQPDLWDGENSHRRGSDSEEYLAVRHDLEMWNSYLDKLVRIKSEIGTDDATYNFASAYDDYVLGSIHIDRYFRYKENNGPIQSHFLKVLIKERFAVIKKFYTQFDKIFQGEGFVNLKAEIQAKNTLDRRNRDFEKNIRDNAKAKLNVPSHSSVFFNEDFLETITDKDYGDREAYLDNHLDDFREPQNSEKVWVIPAAHYGQAEDALSGLELIGTFERSDNYFHSWRKTGYNKILSKFARVHGIPFKDLTNSDKYVHGNSELSKLSELGIEITRKGDSRAGMPGQDYLIEPEELENPVSGEPINRGSAMMWDQLDDEKEKKRFKAFDWSVYPEQMKGLVAKEMKNESTFQFALQNILKKINDGDIDLALKRQNNVDGMAQAAGVEDLIGPSSSEVADNTNWNNLARYLKLNLGVNDQGVNLLKKVYDQYDSDHNWRPQPDPDAIGIKRWAGAVKAAFEYIEKNYTVSAGNYFRKDADGNPGDDVSGVYGSGQGPTANDDGTLEVEDYDRMRKKYRMFDAMMKNGMQLYMLKPDVNRLVSFLNNDDNDELFKQAVLHSMARDQENGEEPNDFQGALARGRMVLQSQQRNESKVNTSMANVFENFEKLSLEEQLKIIRNKKVSESLGDLAAARIKKQRAQQQSHKQEMVTIWDSQPWPLSGSWDNKRLADAGFKRFSKGWKISKDKFDALANPVRKSRIESLQATEMLVKAKKLSENLPNNNKIDIINDILSKEFPAGDIDIQFKAYTALPIPRMMSDFSKLHSAQGPKADGRDVLKHYVKTRMSDQDIKKIKLNENKDDLIAKLEDLPDDENTNKLINYVEQLIDDMGVGGRIQSLSKQLDGIPDQDVKKAIRQIAKIVASVEMSPSERAQLFVDWKADKLVNVDALLNTETVTMSDIYKGYGAKGESHITELVDDLNQVVQYGIGPGEFALSVLSQRISGMGASTGEDGGKGDLIIDGKPIELKTTRKNAARFNDREVTISNDYKTLVTQFFTKYKDKIAELEKSGTKVKVGSGMQQAHVAAFLQAVPEAQDEVANIISNIFTNLPPMGGKIAQLLKSQDINGAMQLIAQTNVSNYLAKKRQSGTVAGILFIDLKKETFNFIKDVTDLAGSGLRLHAKTNYLITTNENPFANTSIVQSKSMNVSEGKKHKICPRTKEPMCQCESLNKITEAEETIKAFCDFEHGDLDGAVYFKQAPGKSTKIYGRVIGLEPGEHGIHIHEFGDLSDGCDSAGAHYNPDGVDHGDLEKGHVGDLGNIVADENGVAQFKIEAKRVDLTGDRSVVGRALVVHADRDDLGKGGDEESLKTGNAGDRLGCGVIRLMNMDESLREAPGYERQPQERISGLYKREQMPQLKPKHLANPQFVKEFNIETRQGIIGLDKLKPAQIDHIPQYVSNIKKELLQYLGKNKTLRVKDYLQGRPFIVDEQGYIVNGHHRYHAIKEVTDKHGKKNTTRVPAIFVNKSIHELVDLFGPGGTAADLTSQKKGRQLSLVQDPDLTDPQIAKYKQELEMRTKRSDSAKRGWQTRKGFNDPRQQRFDFMKNKNNKPEAEEQE